MLHRPIPRPTLQVVKDTLDEDPGEVEGEGGAEGVDDLGVQCHTFVDLAHKEYGGSDVRAADADEVDEDPGDEEVRLRPLQPEQGGQVGEEEDGEGKHLNKTRCPTKKQ